MNPLLIALAYIEAINSKDVDRISKLMSEQYCFIDSDGSELQGRREMLDNWKSYFALVPDYEIEIEESFVRENRIVLLGQASGTIVEKRKLDPKNTWKVPVAMRLVVIDNRVSRFQVFVNPESMVRILDRLGKEEKAAEMDPIAP